MAVIEYTRNVLMHTNANSTEIDENTDYPVIDLMESQKGVVNKGGTMRLGTWNCNLAQGSKVAEVYGREQIWSATVTDLSLTTNTKQRFLKMDLKSLRCQS